MTLACKRRIALITNEAPHYRRPLYELLAQRFELDVYLFDAPDPSSSRLPSDVGVGRFEDVKLRRVRLLRQPLLPGLAHRLTSARYDAVITDLAGRLIVPYAYMVAWARNVPFILWTGVWHHPRTMFHQLTRGGAQWLYRRSDAIIVYGEHVRRALVTVSGVEDGKIFTAAQSVDGAKFSAEARVEESHELVFVGNLEIHKGIADLLTAFAQVEDPTARLSVVGKGSLESDVRRYTASDSRVDVVGFVSQDDLPSRYLRARSLVLPSITTPKYRECWGLVVNEAMHAGVPVISTDAVGAAAHGLVEDGVTGLVVPERDPAALGAAMSRVLEDDALAQGLGSNARDRVSTYTFDAMADAFEAAVEHGIARHEQRAAVSWRRRWELR